MPIKRIESLTGGQHDLPNPEGLGDNQLQKSSNYEIYGDGNLHKRMAEVEFGNYVDGDSLKTVLLSVFSYSMQQISPPYYPVKRIVDSNGDKIMNGDFVLLVFGQTASGVYELYMVYENTATPSSWTATKVDITGIEYTENTYLEFFIGDDKIIITDTYDLTENFPHYVKVDADGELITGLFSIKAPTNKATMQPVTEYNEEDFEEDTDATRLDECGIVQCVYTVVTKEGDESNPSPISDSRMMQFFKKDLTDKNDVRWIDSFLITNLSVPPLTGDLIEQLKYFYVYFRVIRYSEGEGAEPFYFSQRFDIVDKENTVGDTGNGYLVTVPQDESILLSYENDIAPYAKHAAETSGIVGFANIREKIKFPYDFEKYCTIDINNVNNKNFVDAIVAIRIYDTNNTTTLDYYGDSVDYIEDLDLTYYDSPGVNGMINLDLIRIYDDDLTTPIKVAYERYYGAAYIDIYAKIPLLVAGQLKHLYICFNTEDGTAEGVNIDEHKTIEYGQFTKLSADNIAEFFDTERVKSNKTVICAPMDYLRKEGEILNLADDNNSGIIYNDETELVNVPTKQLMTGFDIGTGSLTITQTMAENTAFGEMPFSEIPQKITLWCRIKYDDIFNMLEDMPLIGDGVFVALFTFKVGVGFKELSFDILKVGDEYVFVLSVKDGNPEDFYYKKIKFDDITVPEQAEHFICLSIDRDESVSLFLGDLNGKNFVYQKVEWSNWSSEPDDEYFEDVQLFGLLYDIHAQITAYGFEISYSQFQMIINKYYSAENEDDITAVYNIANFMPSYESALGNKIIIEEE